MALAPLLVGCWTGTSGPVVDCNRRLVQHLRQLPPTFPPTQRQGRLVRPRSTSLTRRDLQQTAQLHHCQQIRWHHHRSPLQRPHPSIFRRLPPSTCMLPIHRCSHQGSSSINNNGSSSKDARNRVQGPRHLQLQQRQLMHWLVMVVRVRGFLLKYLLVENVCRSSNHTAEPSLPHKDNQVHHMQLMIPAHIGMWTRATTPGCPLNLLPGRRSLHRREYPSTSLPHQYSSNLDRRLNSRQSYPHLSHNLSNSATVHRQHNKCVVLENELVLTTSTSLPCLERVTLVRLC